MEAWQIIGLAFLVLLPIALMVDFWPHRERLDFRGRPVQRDWERQLEARSSAENEHH